MSIPAVTQYPTRSPPNTRGRAGMQMPGRWATIERIVASQNITTPVDREEVINISMTIPADRPPELPGLSGAGSPITDRYFLERVPEGVKIGMVRGGTLEAVGGFGFPDPLLDTYWMWFANSTSGSLFALFEDI